MANLADFFSQQPTMTDQTATTQPGSGNLLLQLSQLMQQPKPAMGATPGGVSDLLSQFRMPPPMGPGQAILQALSTAQQQQPVGPSGGMLGGIAQGLAPLAQALTQAPQLQAQSQMNNLAMRLKLMQVMAEMQKAQGNPAKQQADLEKTQAETAKIKNDIANPKAPNITDNAILQGVLANDPQMIALNNLKQKQRQDAAAIFSDQLVQRSNMIAQNKAAEDAQKRLDAPATSLPENKGKVPFNKSDLSNPTGILQKEIDAPDSQYVMLPEKAAAGIRGAKAVQQQIDRLRDMVPELLSETPIVGPAITLAQNKMDQQKTRKAAEFDRLAQFEKMSGIKDFIALRGPNQAEIHNIGGIDRGYDTQAAAMGKLDAMENLISDTLREYNLNPDALRSAPGNPALGPTHAAPATMGLVPRPQPSQKPVPTPAIPKMDTPEADQAIQAIMEKYPKMTASEVADYYSHYGGIR